MSLLYECINGIIQGGILGDSEDDGREEIASLCVSKLRGMITFNGDANCEYTSLNGCNATLTCLASSKICGSFGL